MGRRQTDSEAGHFALRVLFLMGVFSCCMVYSYVSVASVSSPLDLEQQNASEQEEKVESLCCRGIEHLELWREAAKNGVLILRLILPKNVVWLARECALEETCLVSAIPGCFVGLDKLVDPDSLRVVGLETDYEILHARLFPDCAPYYVAYILELLQLRHSAGCQFHRPESRGSLWDSEGNLLENAPFGPPFALVQGTLEAHWTIFKEIPPEFRPAIERGSIAWVDSGPSFFISLANHIEWNKAYTVFGSVLPRDVDIVEKSSQLQVWSNIKVSVLEKPVVLHFRRV